MHWPTCGDRGNYSSGYDERQRGVDQAAGCIAGGQHDGRGHRPARHPARACYGRPQQLHAVTSGVIAKGQRFACIQGSAAAQTQVTSAGDSRWQ